MTLRGQQMASSGSSDFLCSHLYAALSVLNEVTSVTEHHTPHRMHVTSEVRSSKAMWLFALGEVRCYVMRTLKQPLVRST